MLAEDDPNDRIARPEGGEFGGLSFALESTQLVVRPEVDRHQTETIAKLGLFYVKLAARALQVVVEVVEDFVLEVNFDARPVIGGKSPSNE